MKRLREGKNEETGGRAWPKLETTKVGEPGRKHRRDACATKGWLRGGV